jgi:hypothetical protein
MLAERVGAAGLTEGRDHQLYVASPVSTAGLQPWVLRVDPTTGTTQVYARGSIQSTNVRDVAFDSRDSLYVLRVGFEHIIHRTDPVTATVGPLVTLPFGATFGWIAGHPDGGLYHPQAPVSGQYAIYRIDPVTAAVTTLIPPQTQLGYLGVALVRTATGCSVVPAKRNTWGQLKTRYR